ncbi:HEAT repeat domain-containing protein [Streptomyces sp. NPDC127114]|uniref:HEAT repeat domain-containing protein n=1 Tax=Streptomyces sp. NPDC127114 TaxID=3345366 RepID=UPI00363AC9E4
MIESLGIRWWGCGVRDWRTDPTFAMCRALVDGADLAAFVGGAFDVRAVVAGIQSGARRGLLLDAVPWGNFPHGDDAREAVHLLRASEDPASYATGVLGGLCANDSRAAAALAVPFLIRIAADAHHPHRAAALAVLPGPARARHYGVASRDELLLHRNDPRRHAPYDYDDYGVEVTGYPAGWSVAAARAAITAETPVLLPLLNDSDSTIRIDATYALATAADPDHVVRTALAARLATEHDAIVRAALLLAVAEITRAHVQPPTVWWFRERWQDRTEAPEVRLAAAIGWLCLTDEPAPEDLHQTIDTFATEERAHAMDTLPWMHAAGSGEPGLSRCIRCMLHPEEPEPYGDPWAFPL